MLEPYDSSVRDLRKVTPSHIGVFLFNYAGQKPGLQLQVVLEPTAAHLGDHETMRRRWHLINSPQSVPVLESFMVQLRRSVTVSISTSD